LHLMKEPLRMSGLKKGITRAVEEGQPWNKRTSQPNMPEKRRLVIPVRLFGTTSLKEGAM
jgi:hypothetical protein